MGARAGPPDGGAPGADCGAGAGAVAGADGAELGALVCASAWPPTAVLTIIAIIRAIRIGEASQSILRSTTARSGGGSRLCADRGSWTGLRLVVLNEPVFTGAMGRGGQRWNRHPRVLCSNLMGRREKKRWQPNPYPALTIWDVNTGCSCATSRDKCKHVGCAKRVVPRAGATIGEVLTRSAGARVGTNAVLHDLAKSGHVRLTTGKSGTMVRLPEVT